jgi:hypothetical protein
VEGANERGENYPSCAEVIEWLASMIATIRQIETDLPNQHLIAGQEAFAYTPFVQRSDAGFLTVGF